MEEKKKIRWVGKHPCSIKLIDGGVIDGIMSGEIIELVEKDYISLIELGKKTKEWETVEKKEVE